jgi:hypothetical protein
MIFYTYTGHIIIFYTYTGHIMIFYTYTGHIMIFYTYTGHIMIFYTYTGHIMSSFCEIKDRRSFVTFLKIGEVGSTFHIKDVKRIFLYFLHFPSQFIKTIA